MKFKRTIEKNLINDRWTLINYVSENKQYLIQKEKQSNHYTVWFFINGIGYTKDSDNIVYLGQYKYLSNAKFAALYHYSTNL